MRLRNLFHKIKIGVTRIREPSIPHTTAAKQYGNCGEDEFVYEIQSRLLDCKIKKNVIIQVPEGNAEIDCLILYKNKLFAIEIKRWKGQIVEGNDNFIQYKRDRWTNEIHTKYHKSPFKQLGRAVYLLRKQISDKAWLNAVVFFEEADCIEIRNDNTWFDNMNALTSYIVNNGKTSWDNNANVFFEKCICADYLYCKSWGKSLHCIVCDDSLRFNTPEGIITKHTIHSISIMHHWSYDELKIKTVNGTCFISKIENASISVIYNGEKKEYALSKLDYIQFGI